MGKIFTSDPEIEDRKLYAVTRLIHYHSTSYYVEPVSQHSVDQLAYQIMHDIIYYRNTGQLTSRFRK